MQITVVGDGTGSTTISGAVIQNVENLKIANSISNTTSITFDATTVTGLKSVAVASSINGKSIVSNQGKIIDATLSNGKGDLTLSYTSAATAGATDTQNLTLTGQTGGTFTADGIETIALTATGTASSNVTVVGNLATKLTATGAGNVGFTTAIKTIDASALTGNLTLTDSDAAAQVTAGAGNDTISITTLTKDVKVNGGAGTDTLAVTNTSFAADAFTNVSNIETLSLASTGSVTIDTSKVTGLSTILNEAKNSTGASHNVVFGSVAGGGAVVVTLNIGGTDVVVTQNSTANTVGGVAQTALGTAPTTPTTLAAALKTIIDGNTTLSAKLATTVDGNGGLTLTEKTQDAVTITVKESATITHAINGAGAATSSTAVSVGLAAASTSGTLALNNLGANSVVKLNSTNLTPLATDGTTGQSIALNKLGVVTANVKDAALAANTTDAVTFELNNNNTTSTAITATNKTFTVTGTTAADVETVTYNSIGSFGANVDSLSTIAAAKTINVTGTQDLTLTDIRAAATAKLDASTLTGKLTATFTTTAYTDQIIIGGSKDDTVTLLNVTGGDTINLGEGADTLKFTTSADVGILSVSNTETIQISNGGNDAASADLRNATGLTKVIVTGGNNNNTSVLNIPNNATVNLRDNDSAAFSGKGVTISGVTGATTVNVTLGTDGTSTATAGQGVGTGNGANVTLSNGYTTASVTFDGELATGGTSESNLVGTLSTGSVTSLTLNASSGSGTNNIITSQVGTKLTSISISGGSLSTDKTVIAALDDNTSLATIDASGSTSAVYLGANAVGTTFDSYKTKDGAVITTAGGDDIISWLAQNNGANVISAGSGTDTLVILGNLLSPAVVDLSSSTDQVTSFNGTNSAAQTGFENINLSLLSGAGATITAAAVGSVITGTALADNITLGAGVDTIVFGAAVSGVADTITSFTAGASKDILNVTALATLTDTSGSTVQIASTATVGTLVGTAKAFIVTDAANAAWLNVTTIFGNAMDESGTGAEKSAFLISNGTDTRVYLYQNDGVNNAVQAGELTLVGSVTSVLASALDATNVVVV